MALSMFQKWVIFLGGNDCFDPTRHISCRGPSHASSITRLVCGNYREAGVVARDGALRDTRAIRLALLEDNAIHGGDS